MKSSTRLPAAVETAEALRKTLLQEAADKRLRFDRFMEVVLYHPTWGYYARTAERAGRSGDFLTSPEVSPLFGECVAAWVQEVWEVVGRPKTFHVVEVGAGRGTLAASVVGALPRELEPGLRVHLVERGDAPREALARRFASDERVGVYEDVEGLPRNLGPGVFVANELFDNLPVRRLMRADGWKEIYVRIEGKRLREELRPAPNDLVALARAHGVEVDEGQSAEVCETGVPLLESVLGRLDRGGLLVFDYGGEAREVSGDAAPNGTVAAYRGHATHPDLYSNLGEQDLTSNVNFTPLRQAAERLGYRPAHLVTQSHFLLEQKLPERLVALIEKEKDAFQRLRLTQFSKQLYHPESMGGAFRVLYATKRQ